MADKTVQYMPEFRRQMVALARSGRTAASLSKEFGPSAMTIGTWIKQAARDAGKGDGGLSSAERDRGGALTHRAAQGRSRPAAWRGRPGSFRPSRRWAASRRSAGRKPQPHQLRN